MIGKTLKSTALIAAAFSVSLALVPTQAQADKTSHFIGGLAAGVGGLLLYDMYKKGRFAKDGYAPRSYKAPRGYYPPAPQPAYGYNYAPPYTYAPAPVYRPVNTCRTPGKIYRKISRRHGFHSFHNVRTRPHALKMRAWRGGVLYRIKADSCNGQLIWSQAI